MPSLFRRITRYSATAVDPRENRLTEALAAVLERVEGLSGELFTAAGVPGIPPDAPTHVRTQRTTINGNFIDLEIAFGRATHPDLRLWIEIKHGADLHESQLENYARDARFELHAEHRLVLLAPRNSIPVADASVVVVEWQSIAVHLERSARVRSDPIERWLLAELIAYLEEEGLSDEEALTPAHSFVLAARPAADRAVERLLEFADQVVRAEWGDPLEFGKKGGAKPNYLPGSWWSQHQVTRHSSSPETWRDTRFEWGLREDRPRDHSRDAYAFCAGATFLTKNNPLAIAGNEAWLAGLQAHGFERVSDYYWRLWRYSYPEQLMVESMLEAQGRRLGEWVIDAFRILESSAPPN